MNRKEVNNFVKQSISLILEKDGYKYVSLAENFHLKNDDFTYKIGWSCVERWKSCEIGYYIAIRSEKVSKIYNLFSGAQPKYHKQVSNFTLPFTYFTEEQLYKENISVCDATKEKYIINSFLPVYEKKNKTIFRRVFITGKNCIFYD
jgi:hypothetical protein